MVLNGSVHCLFEQSGTFRDAFKEFGIRALDYDIRNDYGHTDYVCDLFKEIDKAWSGLRSMFDYVRPVSDLSMAFFPCIYFSEYNVNLFCGVAHNYRTMQRDEVIRYILQRDEERAQFYHYLIKLCYIYESRGLRLIVENPFGVNHYLYNNFPWTPAIVDFNRRARGDYFRKPTQYFFINCSPANGMTYQRPRNVRRIDDIHNDHKTTKERSEIAPEYARNFIRDFVLGVPSVNSQLAMF